MKYRNLLTTQNAKTSKGESLGYLTGILYLAPANIVSDINVCKFASKGCKASCLYTAGRGKFSNVQNARISKTELFRDNAGFFMESLIDSIKRVERKALREGLKPCIRLNGTSDIRFENYYKNGKNLFEMFPHIQFYDYTKDFKRLDALTGKWNNYHVTFSRNESKVNHKKAKELMKLGINIATVFKDLSKIKVGYIDGDMHDLRFLDDTKGNVIALKAKGDAKKDLTGFAI